MAEKKKAAKKGSEATGESQPISIRRINDAVLKIPIYGLTPVIPHRWSEKARRLMPGHPDGDTVKKAKGKRDPVKEAEGCLYKLGDDLGLPATAFKAAIIGAVRLFQGLTLVETKTLIFVEGEGPEQLVKITGHKVLHEDTAINKNGSADLRYRYYINDWRAELRVRFVPERLTAESVIALVDAAGRSGVGDWRPSSPKSLTGTFGTWRVDFSKEPELIEGGNDE